MTVAKTCYITFPSTYQAIRAEKTLANINLKFKMVPVPRSISSSCGTALRCLPEDAPVIRSSLENSSVEIEGFYKIEENGFAGPLSFLRKRRKDT